MNARSVALSVLDIGPIRSNQTINDCLASMISMAKLAESLGYRRYWLAEHHNVAAVAASQTSVFAAVIGAQTERIRLGGCVLLPHYTPFLVAEQMALLEGCFPGRVDMGIGRSSGADGIASALLRGARMSETEDSHRRNVQQLLEIIRPEGANIDAEGSQYQLRAAPNAVSSVAPWVLGTSEYSAHLAAELGQPYAFGYHIRAEGAAQAIALYRRRFRPSERHPQPKVIVSAIVVVGRTVEEAEMLVRPQLFFMSAFRSGDKVEPQMLAEDAVNVAFPDRHEPLVSGFRRSWIVGDPDKVAIEIRSLCDDLDVDEFMINPVAAAYSHDPANRAPNRELALLMVADHLR